MVKINVTMKLNLCYLSLLVLASSLSVTSQTTVPETDFQIWNETTFILPVVRSKDEKGKRFDRLSLLLITSLRVGQNRFAPVDERIGGGLDLVINKYFNVSPTYLYVAGQPGRQRSEFEHRLRFEVGYSHKFKYFQIKDRNRIEYRFRHSRTNSVRYRNRFSLGVPVTRDKKEIFMPFVSDEVFYDFAAKRWSRNELIFGIQKKFNDHLTSEFFYNWRRNRSGLPQTVRAVGVNLKVKLK